MTRRVRLVLKYLNCGNLMVNWNYSLRDLKSRACRPLNTRVYEVHNVVLVMRRRLLVLSRVPILLRVCLLILVIVRRLNNLCLLWYRRFLAWWTCVLLVP